MNPIKPASIKGAEYWRSLEHLANSPEMQEQIGKEFPGYDVDDMLSPSSRRKFLKLMGASMALAGVTLTGCRRWPEEHLAPYSTNPRGRVPGVPEEYATAMELNGVAQPLLVTGFDGRPIKIEGNPSHPYSYTIKDKLGSADAYAQASLLDMYDPHRSRTVVQGAGAGKRTETNWEAFEAFAKKHFAGLKQSQASFAILSEATSSPSVLEMKKKLLAAFPQAKWYEYEPVSRDTDLEGAKLAFGKPVRTVLHLDKAATVVSLDSDLLGTHPAHVRYAADWVSRRRSVDSAEKEMSRVYVAETTFTTTGSVADHRVPVDPAKLYAIARAIAAKLGVEGISGQEQLEGSESQFVELAAADLQKGGKNAVITAGGAMPPAGYAIVHAINAKLGAVANTVTLHEDPTADRPSHAQAIADLGKQLQGGTVNTLLIFGGNPAYDAPADLKFAENLKRVATSIHLSLYENETSGLCSWHLPRAHYLESWGDARAWDGTAGIVQPLILPLYGGRSIIEVLALISDDQLTSGYDIVRRTWADMLKGDGSDLAIRKVIASGWQDGTAYPEAQVTAKTANLPAPEAPLQGFFFRFVPDSHVFDGRWANNGWLQEIPDSLTKLVWDNAAMIAKKDADCIGVETGDMINVRLADGTGMDIVAYVMPGQPAGVITLPLGYGRTAAGPIGDRLGFNTYAVRTVAAFDVAGGAKVQKISGSYHLVSTQDHHIMDSVGAAGRAKRVGPKNENGMIIREATLEDYKKNPASVHPGPRKYGLQLFERPATLEDTHKWGMTIDLNACIGCNACMVACQAENNIPIVGKVEADNHRAMHWIRVDRYFKGDSEDPNIEVVYQPMTCQQCENAPCEQVCPVGATVHDSEGINTMVYNRCVGTRYCSNNCPYKVRRFNYFDYHSKDPRTSWGTPYPKFPDLQQREQVDKIEAMVFNPDVTVRMRGVMEKCTYCIQRIHRATINKRAEGSDVKDGDIVTACQQTCPTQAITFGNLLERDAEVTKLQNSPRAYGVLDEELDTRPRTKYLAKIRNVAEGATEEKKA